ncbi:MAG: molybdenum cofactor guanylyltransferase MobA [Gammaproteobacteria bacterium]|jgi:molybdenum cofactor guanylyltransferase
MATDAAARQVTAVILAGGRARRMDGQDKGLLRLAGRPMIEYVMTALEPQVGTILVNANRNLDSYRAYGYPVIQDITGGHFGPLAGMASGAQAATTPYLLTVPCDAPLLPAVLVERLLQALAGNRAGISVAHDGIRMQTVFALLRRKLLPDLLSYLENGGRKVESWYARHRLAQADFRDRPDAFLNINTPAERAALEGKLTRQSEAG